MRHASGFAWNHCRNSSEGATSRSQNLSAASSFFNPRGHRRSTSTRTPSDEEAASETRLTTTAMLSVLSYLCLHHHELLELDCSVSTVLRADTGARRARRLLCRRPQ